MGMFDQEVPQELTPLQELQMIGGRMAERTAPFLKESIGYESPEREMRRIASETDLSNSDAVQKTFNFLMSKNPQAAASWLKSVKPVIDQHIASQQKGELSVFEKKLAYIQGLNIPQSEKDAMTKKVLSGVTTEVNIGDNKFKPSIVGDVNKVWQSNTKDYRDKLDTGVALRALVDKARAGEGLAPDALQKQFSKLVGDSRISEGEIARLKSTGSITDRIANNINFYLQGVPTDLKLNEYESVIEFFEDYNYKKLVENREKLTEAYKNTGIENIEKITDPVMRLPAKPLGAIKASQRAKAKELCMMAQGKPELLKQLEAKGIICQQR